MKTIIAICLALLIPVASLAGIADRRVHHSSEGGSEAVDPAATEAAREAARGGSDKRGEAADDPNGAYEGDLDDLDTTTGPGSDPVVAD